jgi:hypothetical protein
MKFSDSESGEMGKLFHTGSNTKLPKLGGSRMERYFSGKSKSHKDEVCRQLL